MLTEKLAADIANAVEGKMIEKTALSLNSKAPGYLLKRLGLSGLGLGSLAYMNSAQDAEYAQQLADIENNLPSQAVKDRLIYNDVLDAVDLVDTSPLGGAI